MNKTAVEITGLEKTYRTESECLTILKNLDFSIEEGTKAVIIGESGSGKSTSLRNFTPEEIGKFTHCITYKHIKYTFIKGNLFVFFS